MQVLQTSYAGEADQKPNLNWRLDWRQRYALVQTEGLRWNCNCAAAWSGIWRKAAVWKAGGRRWLGCAWMLAESDPHLC